MRFSMVRLKIKTGSISRVLYCLRNFHHLSMQPTLSNITEVIAASRYKIRVYMALQH